MKKLMLIITIFISISPAYTQKSGKNANFWRNDLGFVINTNGSQSGIGTTSEYERYVIDNLKIGGGIGLLTMKKDHTSYIESSKAFTIDVMGYYDIVTSGIFSLEAGVGGYLGLWSSVLATDSQHNAIIGNIRLTPGSYKNETTTSVGFALSLGSVLTISPNAGISIRGTLQGDSKSNMMIIPRLGFITRF
jgi:hypothetical protein